MATAGYLYWTTGGSDSQSESFKTLYSAFRRFNILGYLLSWSLFFSGMSLGACGPFSAYLFKRPPLYEWDWRALSFCWGAAFVGRIYIQQKCHVILRMLSAHPHLYRLDHCGLDKMQFADRLQVSKGRLLFFLGIFVCAVIGFGCWTDADAFSVESRQQFAGRALLVVAMLITASRVYMRRFDNRTYARFRDYIGDHDEGAGDLGWAEYPNHWI